VNWLHASTAALNASAKAHRKWDVETNRWIDAFDVAAKRGVFLAFRPLYKLGAAIVHEGDSAGIIVNSNHPLSRQRYSVAHELGHLFFKHHTTLDLNDIFESGSPPKTDEEKLAESFASWFLMPPSLIDGYAARHGIERIVTREQVYQLALFLGTSYESTAHHLRNSKRATPQRANDWLKRPPQDIKEQLAIGFTPASWRNDIHVLDDIDDQMPRLLRSGDHVIVRLPEIPSSGYRWRHYDDARFAVVSESYDSDYDPGERPIPTGKLRMRRFVLCVGDVEERVDAALAFIQARSWKPAQSVRRFSAPVTIESTARLGFPVRYLEEFAA
jgi:Zn-dependent peptidase ImmA (M78 family)